MSIFLERRGNKSGDNKGIYPKGLEMVRGSQKIRGILTYNSRAGTQKQAKCGSFCPSISTIIIRKIMFITNLIYSLRKFGVQWVPPLKSS